MPVLTKTEYLATMQAPMVNVTDAADAEVNIWPYITDLATQLDIPKVIIENQLVDYVYRSGNGVHDHVLLPAHRKNQHLVIIVDRSHHSILGHHVLDLGQEYGLT